MTDTLKPTQADIDAAKAYWGASVAGWREQTAMQDALIQAFARHRLSSDGEREALIEALEPSGATKAAYHGEFSFALYEGVNDDGNDQYRNVYVPWDTVKQIMAAIRTRALSRNNGNG